MRTPNKLLPFVLGLALIFMATLCSLKKREAKPACETGYIETVARPFLCI